MAKIIDKFIGEYKFLSNFYNCKIWYDGILYHSSEAAFQAQKTLDINERKKFSTLSPSQAKALGRKIKLREDWETIKDKTMENILIHKFRQHDDLRKKLVDTYPSPLIEGNTWGDKYWGLDILTGEGENHLGKILEKVRDMYISMYINYHDVGELN